MSIIYEHHSFFLQGSRDSAKQKSNSKPNSRVKCYNYLL